MSKIQGHIDPHKILSICAWCGRKIPKGSEIFSVGAKVKPNIDLQGQPGHAVRLLLEKRRKTVNAIVPTDNSQAKKEGNDLLFAICSPQCGNALKQAFLEELDILVSSVEW